MDKTYIKLAKFTQKIDTIYINKRNLDAFLTLLKRKKITCIIDIRLNTFYKSKEGFSPEKLKKILKQDNISYHHIKELGNPFHKLYDIETEFAQMKIEYLKYLQENEKAKTAFLELFKTLRSTQKYCLLCYCDTDDPLKCHRFWLKEALINHQREKLGLEQVPYCELLLEVRNKK